MCVCVRIVRAEVSSKNADCKAGEMTKRSAVSSEGTPGHSSREVASDPRFLGSQALFFPLTACPVINAMIHT